jgi:hypothetical protein
MLVSEQDPSVPELPPTLQSSAPVLDSITPKSPFDTPSLAPVVMAPSTPSLSSVADPTLQLRPQGRSSIVVVGLASLLAAALAGAVIGIVALSPNAFARGRSGASAWVDRLTGRSSQESKPGAAPAAPPVVVAPVAAPRPASSSVSAPVSTPAIAVPPPAPAPPVAIASAPASNVAPDMTIVTLPASAKGHRVFVDGRVVGNGGGGPMTLKCGTHKVQIGSGGKPLVTDLPCGGELTID